MPELPYGSPPVPAMPIGDMRNWHLEIQCGRCRRHVALQVGHLAELYGQKNASAVLSTDLDAAASCAARLVRPVRARSRWWRFLDRGSQLAKQGEVVMKQQDTFEPIHLTTI
jgi:hypothetical protein